MNDITPSYLPPISLLVGILLTTIVTAIFPHNARRWGAAWVLGLALLPMLTSTLAGWPTVGEYVWQVARSTPVLWIGAVASFEAMRAFDKISWITDRTDELASKLEGKLDKLISKGVEHD